MSRVYAWTLSGVILLAVMSPIAENFKADPEDSFPLSYYPMFTRKRAAEKKETYLLGLEPDGSRHLLHYKYYAGGGLNQVRRQIRRIVKNGGADGLCQTVASTVARRNQRKLANVVSVQIVTGKYNLNRFFSGGEEGKNPVSETIHATCAVKRGES